MRHSIVALILVLAPLSVSAETRLPAFDFTGAAALRAGQPRTPFVAPRARAADVITQGHMLIQAGKEVLVGAAATQEQFLESSAYWSQILREAGIQPGIAAYDKSGVFTLPYKTTDGRVLRSFVAEARQFPPKDETGLRANMALVQQSLTAAGLTPVSARVVNLDGGYLLPTYSILYLATPAALQEREIQVRVMKPGDDVPVELIKKVPEIKIVALPEPWLLVYIGPQLGYVGLWAKTPQDLALRLEKREEYLVSQGKKIIAENFVPIDHPEYKFGVEILFFQ
jgi:hypothetical protein